MIDVVKTCYDMVPKINQSEQSSK